MSFSWYNFKTVQKFFISFGTANFPCDLLTLFLYAVRWRKKHTWPLVTTALFIHFLDRSYISSESFQRDWTKSLGKSFPSNETSIVPQLQCFILDSFWIHPTRCFLSLGPSMLIFFSLIFLRNKISSLSSFFYFSFTKFIEVLLAIKVLSLSKTSALCTLSRQNTSYYLIF